MSLISRLNLRLAF